MSSLRFPNGTRVESTHPDDGDAVGTVDGSRPGQSHVVWDDGQVTWTPNEWLREVEDREATEHTTLPVPATELTLGRIELETLAAMRRADRRQRRGAVWGFGTCMAQPDDRPTLPPPGGV